MTKEHKLSGVLWIAQQRNTNDFYGPEFNHIAIEYRPDNFRIASDAIDEIDDPHTAKILRYLANDLGGTSPLWLSSQHEARLDHFKRFENCTCEICKPIQKATFSKLMDQWNRRT